MTKEDQYQAYQNQLDESDRLIELFENYIESNTDDVFNKLGLSELKHYSKDKDITFSTWQRYLPYGLEYDEFSVYEFDYHQDIIISTKNKTVKLWYNTDTNETELEINICDSVLEFVDVDTKEYKTFLDERNSRTIN